MKLCPLSLSTQFKAKKYSYFWYVSNYFYQPFFAEVVKGVERRCYEEGYSLLLCHTEGDLERLRFNIDMLLQKRVDGLLLMSDEISHHPLDIFSRHKAVPTVVLDSSVTSFPADTIQDNSLHGGYLATQHLIEKGHVKIGCITGPLISKWR
ncbi:hypothetical protein ACLKMH_07240 [Psychromonas sp. KJ10-10]|uniref:hypothetical protein n=1 Tax=Psychromonas sp. KJ10-10 TaxID=3391823 RepID=UPI0039B3A9ED